MEPKHPTDMTIGQAHGGLLKKTIERLNLVENQVLTQEEASLLLNYSVNKSQTWQVQDLLERVSQAYTQKRREELRAELATNPDPNPL